MIDVVVKRKDYVGRAIELGHDAVFSTEHGCSGNIFELYDQCKEAGLKAIFGMEMYFTKDHLKKEGKNWHICVIALNYEGYRAINRISSEANINGFYYQPRVDVDLLLTLPPRDVVITTACINNPMYFEDDDHDVEKEYLIPMRDHFGDHFFIEVQSHNDQKQISFNLIGKRLAEKHNIPLIAGVDSHYIQNDGAKDRNMFLEGKGLHYGEEDGFLLDYPSGQELISRFIRQGVFNKEEAISLLGATHIFEQAEDLGFNDDFKTPTIYPDLSLDERLEKLKNIIFKKFKSYARSRPDLPREELKKQSGELTKEFNVIKETNDVVRLADYFLFNYEMIKRGQEEYGGVLTKSGRGSASGYFINYLLGFTSVNRFDSVIPLYPSRFITTTRLLENHSVADIDFNTADDEPFIKASKDLLGENGCYRMVAYGTMQEASAIKNVCRAYGIEPGMVNEVTKDIDKYRDDPEWKPYIDEAQTFIDTIDNISPSPCSFLLLNDDIRESVGVIRIKDELCAAIDGDWAQRQGCVKNDILRVSVWKLIADTFKEINQEIPTIPELQKLVNEDVWKMYSDGYTATLNQVGKDGTHSKVVKYSPKNIAELSAFVAAVRPGFKSLVENFIERKPYTTGVPEIDEVLSPSFNYMLYQESIMQVLSFLGVEESGTYDVIKKISKKRFTEDEQEKLMSSLEDNFKEKTGSTDGFDGIWQVIHDAADYSFNSAHAICVAWDSVYGAYLKSHYPLQYFTVCFNHYKDDLVITSKLTTEASRMGIKVLPARFGLAKADYAYDINANTISKGVGSVKNINNDVADKLYELSKDKYDNIYDLFSALKDDGITKKHMETLIKVNYFQKFGGNKKLLKCYELFRKYGSKKQFKKDFEDAVLTLDIISKYAGKETEKLYQEIDMKGLLLEVFDALPNDKFTIKEQMKVDFELIGSPNSLYRNNRNAHYVKKATRYGKKSSTILEIFNLQTGESKKVKVKGKIYNREPIKEEDVIFVGSITQDGKWQKIDNTGVFSQDWVQTDEMEDILETYTIYKQEGMACD